MADDYHHPKRDEKACACFYEGDGDWLCCVHCNTLFEYDARIATLEAENARLTKERDAWRLRVTVQDKLRAAAQALVDATQPVDPRYVAGLAAVLREPEPVDAFATERARSARLLRYARHHLSCASEHTDNPRFPDCTCGYDAALADAPDGVVLTREGVEAVRVLLAFVESDDRLEFDKDDLHAACATLRAIPGLLTDAREKS